MRKAYLLGAAALCFVGVVLLWQVSKSRTFQAFGVVVPRVNTSRKVIALTFDDGPTRDRTGAVLAVLGEKKVRATFFVTGRELERNPVLGREIIAAGHELANHSYSHAQMIFVSPSFVRREVERTDELIREAGYTGEIHFRPPYGKKLLVLPYYLAQNNRKTIMCDVEPDSYPEVAKDAAKIAEYVRERARPGSIILLHVMYQSREESLKAVGGIIDGLEGEGYRFVTVSELLEAAN